MISLTAQLLIIVIRIDSSILLDPQPPHGVSLSRRKPTIINAKAANKRRNIKFFLFLVFLDKRNLKCNISQRFYRFKTVCFVIKKMTKQTVLKRNFWQIFLANISGKYFIQMIEGFIFKFITYSYPFIGNIFR